MGNRATIEIMDTTGATSPALIYVHNSGGVDGVAKAVNNAAGRMRDNDAHSAMVVLLSAFLADHTKEGSLAIIPSEEREQWDAGHFLIDMSAGEVHQFDADHMDGRMVARNIEFKKMEALL